MCQVYAKKILNVEIKEYNVIRARNIWMPGFTKISRINKNLKDKEIAFKFVLSEIKKTNLEIEEKIITRGKNKGTIRYIDEAMDMTDSYVLMQAYLKENKNG